MLAGKEYGSGSSRDWAAKGPRLLGVRFVIAESLRAHPPLEPGRAWASCRSSSPTARRVESLGLTGKETFDLAPLEEGATTLKVTAKPTAATRWSSRRRVRIDTPNEWLYYRHGGILHFVLRQLLKRDS